MKDLSQEMALVMELAKINMVRDQRVAMVAFIHQSEDSIALFPMEQAPTEQAAYELLRALIINMEAIRVLVVAEGHYRYARPGEVKPAGPLEADPESREAIFVYAWELGEQTVIRQTFERVMGSVNFIGVPELEPSAQMTAAPFFPPKGSEVVGHG